MNTASELFHILSQTSHCSAAVMTTCGSAFFSPTRNMLQLSEEGSRSKLERRTTLSFSLTFNPFLSLSPSFRCSPHLLSALRFLACFRRLTCKQNKSSFGRRVERGMAREKLAGNVSKGSVRLFSLNQNHPLRAVNSNAASASQSCDLPHKLWHEECMKAASLQTKISELGFVSDGFVGPSGDGTLVLRSACDSQVGVKSRASHWRSKEIVAQN